MWFESIFWRDNLKFKKYVRVTMTDATNSIALVGLAVRALVGPLWCKQLSGDGGALLT